MPSIDLIDETYLVADLGEVAERFADPALWRQWWPDLQLTVAEDRGIKGQRWQVRGELVGSCEVWLEPAGDGVIVHYFVRAEPTRRGRNSEPLRGPGWWVRRRARRVGHRHAAAVKRRGWALKDELEAGRAPGTPRIPAR